MEVASRYTTLLAARFGHDDTMSDFDESVSDDEYDCLFTNDD